VNTWKVILATMVIFGSGVITGGLLVRQSQRVRPPQNPGWNRPVPAPNPTAGGMRLEFLRRAQRELKLSPDQHQRIDTVLRQSQERIRNVMEPVQSPLREELQHAREQVRNILEPRQRARFDEILRQQHQTPPRVRDPRVGGTNVWRQRERAPVPYEERRRPAESPQAE
jgi:hypothetical protein